jgi:TonB family protein
MSAVPSNQLPPTHRRELLRWLLAPPIALVLVWLLVLLMEWMIRAPEIEARQQPEAESVQMVRLEPQKEQPQDAAAKLPDLAPPPPPAAPPSLARPALPAIAVPAISIAPAQVNVATTGTPVDLGSSLGLSTSGAFGGFAGSGGGNGSGGNGIGNGNGQGGGFARGQGFSGKELIPLSTARPQMPAWACKQKIKGWVEVVFVVNTTGTVENVRIVDAQPRGVFESAAIESVSHWIYPRSKQAQEVKQRVPMDPEDCAFNYGQ